MPRRTISAAERCIDRHTVENRTSPRSARWKPLTRLKKVLLPGAVRPDNADDLAALDGELVILEGDEAAERFGQPLCCEQRSGVGRRNHHQPCVSTDAPIRTHAQSAAPAPELSGPRSQECPAAEPFPFLHLQQKFPYCPRGVNDVIFGLEARGRGRWIAARKAPAQLQHASAATSAGRRRLSDARALTLLASYPVVGLKTVAQFAARAHVSGPTILPLVAKLGFVGYLDFQQALRNELELCLQPPSPTHRRNQALRYNGLLAHLYTRHRRQYRDVRRRCFDRGFRSRARPQ